MLSATGRKYLRGPRGTGFLYVNNKKIDRLIPPFLDLHSAEWTTENEYVLRNDARRFENWEMNYAGIMGLKAAVEYAQDIGIKAIWKRISHLAEYVRSELPKIPTVSVHDIGYTKGGIISFSVQSIPANEIKAHLANVNINVSVSTKSSTLVDMSDRGLNSLVRASVHYYNTKEEIQKFLEAIRNLS
jgi:selenocysteine lyase/cysteine desulfurase